MDGPPTYINAEGLTYTETRTLHRMLKNFHSLIGPCLTRDLPLRFYTDLANRIQTDTCMSQYFRPFILREDQEGNNIFLSETYSEGRKVIVDPIGVPVNSHLCPYAGLLDNAPEPNRSVYERMEGVVEWGHQNRPRVNLTKIRAMYVASRTRS